MDDIWSTQAWNDVKMCLPNDYNGSRVILTSRLVEVAVYSNPHSPPHHMNLLGINESWALLQRKLFPKGSCPPELAEIGKKIAEKCQGLPLAILAVAGQLSKMSKTEQCWMEIIKTVDSLVTREPEQCLNILAMSYDHLPVHLKPCFLYIGTFPEDSIIPVRTLSKLWVAEGFLKPQALRSMEEAAEQYLEDLVDRNLVMVGKWSSTGRFKTCLIHDLLRDLCLRKAESENFIVKQLKTGVVAPLNLEMNSVGKIDPCHIEGCPFRYSLRARSTQSPVNSFFCHSSRFEWSFFRRHMIFNQRFRQIRVLHIVVKNSFRRFPVEVIQLSYLRYLELSVIHTYIPRTIDKLWLLQTLIMHDMILVDLPQEIWKMLHLRHIKISHSIRSMPYTLVDDGNHSPVLTHLQTLSAISPYNKKFFSRTPNLINLAIDEFREYEALNSPRSTSDASESIFFKISEEKNKKIANLNSLICLEQLERLKCDCFLPPISQWNAFPGKLKKLTLIRSLLSWGDVEFLGSLPHLEVLKLKNRAFIGQNWDLADIEFGHLKFLQLLELNLVNWEADSINFPCLQRLVIKDCKRLNSIPEGFGEISTLKVIELDNVRSSVLSSAKSVQQDQENFGNADLKIHIGSSGGVTMK